MKRKRSELIHRGKHPLSRRQLDAILAIARTKQKFLSNAQLERAIGSYATNVIRSLAEDRQLIVFQYDLEEGGHSAGAWFLTEKGWQVIQELADERSTPASSSSSRSSSSSAA